MTRLIVFISLLFLLVAASVGFFINNQKNQNFENTSQVINQNNEIEVPKNLDFKSLIENITYEYQTEKDKFDFTVKEVGKVKEGRFEGFDKKLVTIRLSREGEEYSDTEYQLFAVNDYNYIVTKQSNQRFKVNFKNTATLLNEEVPSNLPNVIKIDDYFSLRTGFYDSNSKHVIDKDSYDKYQTSDFWKLENKNWNNYDILSYKNSATYYLNDEGTYIRYGINVIFNPTVSVSYYQDNPIIDSIAFKKPLNSDFKYTKYELTYDGGISFLDPSILNIPDSEMKQISSEYGPTIYVIKNTNNKEYQELALDRYKGRVSKKEGVENSEINHNKNIQQGAIIFLKNPIGGYMMFFEAEETYSPLGGGKPVVYLYPEKETEVTIKFNKEMKFSNTVPNYTDSWKVLAKTNGEIIDLKPQLTDCANIKITKSTLYAKEACEKNSYPYLYWSGGVINSYILPTQDKGFVVEKDNLEKFFTDKLTFIGFSQKEINDFNEFWVSELNSKNKKYFVINFLQNEELDKLFPMTVNPKPDTQIRVFMDWNGYDELPSIKEQKLIKYNRTGFTLVEWGGHRKF